MTNSSGGPYKLKPLVRYLAKSLKFYELKNEGLTRAVFLTILVISFAGAFTPENIYWALAINVVGITIIHLASTVYLAAFIKDLRSREYTLKSCFALVAGNAYKVLISSVTYLLTVVFLAGLITDPMIIGTMALILLVPVILVLLMFLFNVCFIVDKHYGIAASYRESRRITTGCKGALFLKLLGFNFIVSMPMSFIWMLAFGSGNAMIANFVLSFTAAIVNLVQQRFIALMYMDLEYGEMKSLEGL